MKTKDLWVVTYVGLSEEDSDANGYTEVKVFDNINDAKSKLQEWRNAEIENLVDEERDYEILVDEKFEVRIGWCGQSEQVRILVHKVELNK